MEKFSVGDLILSGNSLFLIKGELNDMWELLPVGPNQKNWHWAPKYSMEMYYKWAA